MRAAVLVVFVATVMAAGCVEVADPALEPMDGFRLRREPSMMPTFEGPENETYKMVAIHQHVGESVREAEEYRTGKRQRVVCIDLNGEAAPDLSLGSKASMDAAAPCAPSYDPGLGRLFADEEQFAKWAPWAVVASGPCGAVHPLTRASPGLQVQAPGGPFRLEFLANESLRVDDWLVEPGTALKIDYRIPGDDPRSRDDDRPVTLVFDYPGQWLRSRVGPWQPGEPIPPPPTEGDGPEARVPRSPIRIGDVLLPLQEASPGAPENLSALRATMLDGQLTGLSVEFSGAAAIRWSVAGVEGDMIRMLGRSLEAQPANEVPLSRFLLAFNASDLSVWTGPRSASTSVDLRWAPDLGLRSASPIAWSETWMPSLKDCGPDCRFVWAADPQGGMDWRRADASEETAAKGAVTLQVALEDGAGKRERLFFRP